MKKNSVLFVDDDINVLSSLRRGLIDEEYKSFFATGGQKALAIMEENEISVIVSDMRMPEMDGLKLLKIIKEKYPDTVKIVLTGYTQLQQVLATINQVDIFKFITKPWNMEEDFKIIIRQAVEYYNFLQEKKKQEEALEKRNAMYMSILKSTDEKFLQNKNDLENLKEISKYVIGIVKEQAGSSNNSEKSNSIRFIEDLYHEYLKVFPTSTIDFQTDKLESDLNKWLTEKELQSWVNINKKLGASATLKGNYTLIYYIISTLLEKLHPYVEEKGLDLSMDVKDDSLIIFVTTLKIDKCLQSDFINSITTEILISFLDKISRSIGCNMVTRKQNDGMDFEFKIPVQA